MYCGPGSERKGVVRCEVSGLTGEWEAYKGRLHLFAGSGHLSQDLKDLGAESRKYLASLRRKEFITGLHVIIIRRPERNKFKIEL